MNIKDYEDAYLDDESYDDFSRGPRKFRIPKEGGKHRNKHKDKQNIRKQRQQKERMRNEVEKSNDWEENEDN